MDTNKLISEEFFKFICERFNQIKDPKELSTYNSFIWDSIKLFEPVFNNLIDSLNMCVETKVFFKTNYLSTMNSYTCSKKYIAGSNLVLDKFIEFVTNHISTILRNLMTLCNYNKSIASFRKLVLNRYDITINNVHIKQSTLDYINVLYNMLKNCNILSSKINSLIDCNV